MTQKRIFHLSAQNGNEGLKITISNSLIQINAIEKNMLNLQIQDYKEQSELRHALEKNLETLVDEIDKWKDHYLLESPVAVKNFFFQCMGC